MDQPALVAVDDDGARLDAVRRELEERYGRHYRVVCLHSPDEARACLRELAASGTDVALVLAAQRMDGAGATQLLDDVRRTHPHARRALVIEWGEWGQTPTGEAIFDGIAHGRLDHFVIRPMASPDELFHQSISTMLLEWTEEQRSAPYTVRVVGESWSGRAYELREALQRCAIPHHFCLADSAEGRAIVAETGHAADPTDLPLMVFPNGHVLVNPSNTELARAAGAPTDPSRLEFDLIVVGGGPAGLSAAVYGASEGLSTLVVDPGGIGGQATSSSLIRNYLGFSRGVSGRRLAREAYDQAWIFGARFAFMHTVEALDRDGDDLLVTLSETGQVRTTAVLLAMGARYRRLGVESLEALTGAGVFYGGSTSEAAGLAGADAFVVGGANSAGQAVLHLARYARRATLVVRGPSLRAGMSDYLVNQVEATPNIDVRVGTEVVGGGGAGRLEHLVLRDLASGTESTVEAQALFVLIGAEPFTDWLPPELQRDPQGFVLTGADLPGGAWPLERAPFALETSMPGVLASGDVRHGSVKRVASAVGEGSIAVQAVHRIFASLGREPRGRLAGDPSAVG
jgi:thioredoxin reductase (NADPH)